MKKDIKQSSEKSFTVSPISQYVDKCIFENKKRGYELSKEQKSLKPEINYSIETKLRNPDKKLGLYESILDIKLSSSLSDGTKMFDMEMEYVGLFKFTGETSQGVLNETLLVNCMELIFPFARREISNAMLSAGYTPTLLDPIDFKKSYRKHKEKILNEAESKSKGGK